jgi:hypothetical protein
MELRTVTAGGGREGEREENAGIIWGWGWEVASEASVESKAGGHTLSAGVDGSCGLCDDCGMATAVAGNAGCAMRGMAMIVGGGRELVACWRRWVAKRGLRVKRKIISVTEPPK